MINARPRRSNLPWLSLSSRRVSPSHAKTLDLISLLRDGDISSSRRRPSLEKSLAAALKSISSLSSGAQIHSLSIKSGVFFSSVLIRNGIMNLYAKCRQPTSAESIFQSGLTLDSASFNIMVCMYMKLGILRRTQEMFDEMPERDGVSYTTMIMALSQHDKLKEALIIFHEMLSASIFPNEVTISTLVTACSNSKSFSIGRALHAIATKLALDVSILVSTTLVHLYAMHPLTIDQSEAIFFKMPERSIVTWNAMLNGYAKAGLPDAARNLFVLMPSKDLVSWGTLIDGYLRMGRLREAVAALRELNCRPNEVILVNLLSACCRLFEFEEGRKLHALSVKSGLDSFGLLQATIIHFYGESGEMDLACSQFSSRDTKSVSAWNALMGGYVRNGMLRSAHLLFEEMPIKDLISWSTMISGYSKNGLPSAALDLFQEMRENGIEPSEITVLGILPAISSLKVLKQGRVVHELCSSRFTPFSDNLVAALVDMYAKCGSIEDAIEVFNKARNSPAGFSVSPWNALICGLASHGRADMAMKMFSEMEMKKVEPNAITFLGILGTCCHKGLVVEGKRYFEGMRKKYKIEPTIKHYGCMVDLFGRAGLLKEAEELVSAMPMEPDVVIWGAMLAASRTHGNVEIGEKAAAGLAGLNPQHGSSKVVLSNIYADAGQWEDVALVRLAMQAGGMKKTLRCSGVV